MSNYTVLNRFRNVETREVYEPGDIVDFSEERAERAINALGKGFLELESDTQKTPENEPIEPAIDNEPTEPVTDNEFPKHIGGGVYVLSNGEKVKSKEAAQAAEDALQDDTEE